MPSQGAVDRRDLHVILTLLDHDARLHGPLIAFHGSFEGTVTFGELQAPFSNVPVTTVRNGHVWYGSGGTFRLHETDGTFPRGRQIRWPDATEPLADAEVTRLRDATLDASPTPRHRQIVAAMFADVLRPRMRPAFRRLLVDRTGRLWVSRFEPPPWHRHERLWYIISPDSAAVYTLSLPRERTHGLYLADVAMDRILLIVRDAVGVQTIAVVQYAR